ncbi:transporter [Rhodoblastus sp. 17X3]|uniref:SphA family protein n=1 Tax=Rhodoblastus sp. 17X3 TaxID=3047026 RepID=UPI0024B6BE74|nr:transporter [Rhodoblastus sp. 17X3]MDI9848878.1 transporter [Rhodoblastus sp. 17X3]
MTAAVFGASLVAPCSGHADETGLSLWIPGQFGSFAAVPGQPGLAFTALYYHPSVSASGEKAFLQGGRFEAGLQGRGDLVFAGPSYIFATPVLGGQASVSLLGVGGQSWAQVAATLTGPHGNAISGQRSQSVTSFGDLIPQAALKWNQGVNNFMIYGEGDIPVGDYNATRLVTVGLGHGAIDGGAGYTYLNPTTGYEFSAVAGVTYNFINPSTQYQNGVDAHLDVGASRFLSKQLNVGIVGYVFQQITGDQGAGARLGAFQSRVAGVGPQLNYFFPVTDKIAGVLNVKGYKEFAAENRPEGWNVWATLVFSAAPTQKP